MPDAKKLQKAIRSNGFTQREFAKMIGSNETWLSYMVNNDTNATERSLAKMCKALGCKPEDIMLEVEN